jgi:hypothetical protein
MPTATQRERSPYVFLTGKGRSGTTWIANILATHPHCVYKHEPFLDYKPTPFRDFLAALPTGDVETLRRQFERACRGCHASIDEPLPQQAGMRRLPPRPLALLRRAAIRIPALDPLYGILGRPRLVSGDAVLIKDVNFPNELLDRLCDVVSPRLLAVVRNPFANVASLLQGRDSGAFWRPPSPDGAERVLELLERPELAHLRRFQDQVRRMPVTAFEALRWRIQAEPLADFATRRADARLIVYEEFCRDPFKGAESLFSFAGWRLLQPTIDFIEESTRGPKPGLDVRRSYFSVHRNADESLNKWKSDLTLEQQQQIAEVVKDSPLLDFWPELPLPR